MNTIFAPCPKCGTIHGFLSRTAGQRTYALADAPDDVLTDVGWLAPYTCHRCRMPYQVRPGSRETEPLAVFQEPVPPPPPAPPKPPESYEGSVLEALGSFSKSPDGDWFLYEEGDCYDDFTVELTREDLVRLAGELLELAKT